MSYGFRPNPGRFTCDFCNCKENAAVPLFCKATRETYHKECLIVEARKRKKFKHIHLDIGKEYEDFYKQNEQYVKVVQSDEKDM